MTSETPEELVKFVLKSLWENGYAVVPMDPNMAMIRAAWNAGSDDFRDIWEAMVRASPFKPQE